MRARGTAIVLLVFAIGPAQGASDDLHIPLHCLDTLPLPTAAADERTRAVALQALSPERFARLTATDLDGFPESVRKLLTAGLDYTEFRSAVRASPLLAGRRLAPEPAAWYVANRLPVAETRDFWPCVNAGSFTLQPAAPLVGYGDFSLVLRWSNLPVDDAPPLRWAGVNIDPIAPPPDRVAGSGEVLATFSRAPGQSVTLLVELGTRDGPVRAQFLDPVPPESTPSSDPPPGP